MPNPSPSESPPNHGVIRVGFDCTACYVTRAGLARYVKGLQRGLQELHAPDLALIPLAWEVENFGYGQPLRALKTAYRELVWGRAIAPARLRRAGAAILHSTSSLFIHCPRDMKHIVTLHDMSISRHPERFRRWQVDAWHRRLAVVTSADRVICISRFTADEAISLLGLAASKIEVIHNGCDWHDDQISFTETPPTVPVPREFFLFVGSLEPGKNVRLLREVWLRAENEGRRLPPLVLVGSRRDGVSEEGRHPAGWHPLGHQSDGVLLHLYRRAIAMVFPSIYEGFGLPVVEAMTQGCPVICSRVSSLPEVAGEAALIGDPEASWYLSALREMAARADLRADLAQRGRRNAQRFRWSRCAHETAAIYRATVNAGPSGIPF